MRPVGLSTADLEQRRVVRGCLDVLNARDLRHARLPVVRVLVQRVGLRAELRHLGERPGADRVRVEELVDVRDLREHVLGHDEDGVQVDGHELRVLGLQRDDDLVGALLLDRGDVRPLAVGADHVHRLVLLAGREAVDDVGRGQRLAVRPLDARAQVQRDLLAVLAPGIALREPLVLLAAAGRRGDHERLVHAAADEGGRGDALHVRVEVANEGWIARARGHQALVCGG